MEVVRKHLPKSVQSAMEHLHMIRKGIRPTPGTKVVEINELMESIMEPDIEMELQELPLNWKHKVGVAVFKFNELNGMISTDLPGQFPITSARGNAYILVMYCYTNNAILATGIKSRRSKDLVKRYDELYKELLLSGIISILQRMDNEVNEDLIKSINNKNLTYQVASPGDHRLLLVERSFQTFQNYFISILYSVNRTFPANQWDQLIKQTVKTLNMVCRSQVNPQLSIYQQIWGNFDFNRTPMGIPGCKAMVHL